jgi:hypothetical protein
MNARLVTALSLAAVAAAGCVDNDASVHLFALCSAPEPGENGGCIYPAACDAILLGPLAVDIFNPDSGGSLYWPVQVNNQMEPNNDASAGRLDTHTAWIESYVISYRSTTASIPDIEVGISSHPVEPGGSTVVIVPVVPPSVVPQLRLQVTGTADLTAEVNAKGRLADGTTFETGPFTVAVNIFPNAIPTPTDADCRALSGDPASTAVYVASCPQPGQTSVIKCK